MGRVTFEGVIKRFGATTALAALDLDIADGEFVSLLGPSGCGKTTALRILAGLAEASAGRVLLDGRDIAGMPPERRDLGMVFQDYALFPHMSVADNIAFPLRERRRSRTEIDARVAELLELIKLPGLGGRYPAQLSGGQQQRVALARAVAASPRVLLMDEPLGALDLKLREAMQAEILRIHRTLRVTTLYVTHDQGEAIALSSRIAVMRAGRVEQLGTPEEIYRRPRTRFVAEFVGRINLAAAQPVGEDKAGRILALAGNRLVAPPGESAPSAGGVSIAVRPEMIVLVPSDLPGHNTLPGRVLEVSFAGSAMRVSVDVGADAPWQIDLSPSAAIPSIGSAVRLAWPIDATILLSEES